MDHRRISAAKRRLKAHMSAYGDAKDKMDVTMWSEDPLVIADFTCHTKCGACWGVISDLHAAGLHRVRYPEGDNLQDLV